MEFDDDIPPQLPDIIYMIEPPKYKNTKYGFFYNLYCKFINAAENDKQNILSQLPWSKTDIRTILFIKGEIEQLF